MLLASKQDRHPTELAGLVGRRLVSAIETEKSRRWAEAKIKSLTGGDMVTARFMCRDFFDFTPRFKIIVVGNTKPALNTVDEAMKRRFHLVPFTVTIPPEKRDLGLGEKLKAEWPGILHWAIEGCLEWQKIGLAPPKAVTEATNDYLSAQDTVTNWLTECTEADQLAETSTSALYKAWGEWCEANGERPGTSKAFSQALLDRGYTIDHTRRGNMVRGLRIAAGQG
jgi:putative DNA primase/helicase